MAQTVHRVGRTPRRYISQAPSFGKRPGASSGRLADAAADFDHELWRRIDQMSLDDPSAETPVSKRLAAENKWTASQTATAIREYKRFLYLTQRVGSAVTPSRPVDKVWHEHLMHTRHYWDVLCGQVLQQKLHHDPGDGSRIDGAKLQAQYAATLDSYRKVFGEDPPLHIWPRPANRSFGTGGKIFSALLLGGVGAGIYYKITPLVIFCGFAFIVSLIAVAQQKKASDRGGCGAGCGGGGICSGGGTSDSFSSSDGSDGGGASCGGGSCGGGGD